MVTVIKTYKGRISLKVTGVYQFFLGSERVSTSLVSRLSQRYTLFRDLYVESRNEVLWEEGSAAESLDDE